MRHNLVMLDIASPPPSQTTPPAQPPKNEKPSDRATTFQAVEGGEVHSGQVLLVEAYAAIWLFLLAFVGLSWMKQAKLHARLDELERVVDRAAAKLESSAAGQKSKPAEPAPSTTAGTAGAVAAVREG